MQKYYLLSLLILLNTVSIKSYSEFLYPVSSIIHEEQEKICVLYQNKNHLEVWIWDPITHEAIKGILSSFTPAGVTSLPNHQGFSFIDNDRIRLKQINKRSPKSIDLYGPYDLTTINWIDNSSFYFGAKERQHGNLFHGTIDGDLFRLTVSNSYDYLYPAKIDNDLFFVEKSDDSGYAIMHTKYPTEDISIALEKKIAPYNYGEENNDEYKEYINFDQTERIIILKDLSPAFLKMETTERGFFIEHPQVVNRTDETMTFSYFTFFKEQNEWKIEKLFEFVLPLHLLLPIKGKTRLHESILPFLPVHDKELIYYSNLCLEDNTIGIASYNIHDKTLSFIKENNTIMFTPFNSHHHLFYGGSLSKDSNSLPKIEIDEAGNHFFTFLEF